MASIMLPFETKPADDQGIAKILPVEFKAADNTATGIVIQTLLPKDPTQRKAELQINVSDAEFIEFVEKSADLYKQGAPFCDERLSNIIVYAQGCYTDGYDCIKDYPPFGCDNPQPPFDLTDDHDVPSHPTGSGFVVSGDLNDYPEGTVVKGNLVLVFG